ncbi:MAG: antitoxin [Novosphingobium sp. 28-62-57]|uniref:antitoxin n=1 Tax=unclassified Novosphingobium TaxID=2644732 RepID=UPI000BC65ABA|nr:MULTISPECIES: antitoxin [unclassified Novosphingobium]OYW47836.1 MAG: antitoxin [Novosphingobium sp. 12-63-9]OYZ10730.1 MAG: antitoxin [Novosphingobium sp. 28-62-57]OZA40422.1 MAG: antitoxin [Novosphingobium sp. 17-62-9]HQS68491.1 antitoxin [Novosphingobium sp.]
MSSLTIDITDHQLQSLNALAALQGKTIKQYALERLFPSTEEDQAWHDLNDLLEQRISEGLGGAVSGKNVRAILEDELGAGAADDLGV